MRTLTVQTSQALSSTVTKPGYLVEVYFTPILRFSTFDTLDWNDQTWTGEASCSVVEISDMSGKLTFGNITNAMSSLILNDGVVDRRVKLWAFDKEALGVGDPVLVFDGVADAAELTLKNASITLTAKNSGTLSSPRRFIGESSGFTQLIPAGTVLRVRSTKVTLSRW